MNLPWKAHNRLLAIFCYGLLVIGHSAVAQAQAAGFTPAAENMLLLKSLADKYEQQYKVEIASLPAINKKDFEEIYRWRHEHIKSRFDNKEIYTSPEAQGYLDALAAEIIAGNPLLKSKNFRCYFSRSGVPNASYIGEGIILFNMGLFHRLQNESEAAFVLCHEIAHFHLQHSENSIREYVTMVNSEAMQKELRKIKSTEYGRREQLDKLLKGLTFDSRRHGRNHESEADSMALEFMRHTRFDISKTLTALSLLDVIDTDSLKMDACLQSVFNAKEYPFQKRWLAKEEGLLGGHAQLKDDQPLADSLKTHPDCKSRIRQLEPLVAKYRSGSSLADPIDAKKMNSLRNSFRYEIIEWSFTSGNYCGSLYNTLEMLQRNPHDPYLVAQTGKIFNGFYTAQKAHTLGKICDLPAPYYPSNYNLLLQFIQNLYLENFAGISYHFLKQYHPDLDAYSPFKETYNTSIQISK